MSDPHWESLKEIFHATLALPKDERSRYLDEACGGDLALRSAVESLLKSHEESNNFIDSPAFEAAAKVLMDDARFNPGDMVGHYRILSLIGEGGMGTVYLAEDAKLHRKICLKFLSSLVTQDKERLVRFEQEARAASALNHPNIITIHEIGAADDRSYMAMEYIAGQTLRERLHSPIEIDEALEIAIQIASALTAAHRAKIIHRDIKPDNIMIREEDGLVKVLDFGLAKILQPRRIAPSDPEAETRRMARTGEGVVMGTVAYMSPEQARGQVVDERTDVWSLGVVLYEMIAGATPFAAASSNEIISGILSKQPPAPLTRFARDIPERLEEIVDKALTKNPQERYQTSQDLLTDLKRLKRTVELQSESERSAAPDTSLLSTARATRDASVPARPTQAVSSAEYIVNQVKSHKRAATITVAALLMFAIAGSIYVWRLRQAASGDSAPTIGSIAVLPLTNVNADPDTEFLSDGITDNIIDRLSQLSGLKVMAHTAVFRYKGREVDPRTIGAELGVEAVLNGRLTKRNDAVTINLELVSTKDNSHLWGQQYERKLSELLIVQREIPLDVSEKLRLKLSTESKERLARTHTDNLEAYQLYLKGLYSWEKWTRNGAREALGFFDEAIKKDPNYALAYSGLAAVYLNFGMGVGPDVPQKEAHRRAREAAMKALSLDPQLGEAHAAMAHVLLYDDWDFTGAERELRRAIELNPSYAEGHHAYSHLLLLLGRTDESLAESKKLLELDPVSETPIGHLGYHYLCARQYDEAIQQYQKDRQLYPDLNLANHLQLAAAYYQKGMFDEAVEEYLKGFAGTGYQPDKIAELRKAFAKSGIRGFYEKLLEQYKATRQTDNEDVAIAEFHARLGQKDQAFEWLEKAYAAHDDGLVRLKEEVGFDNLRSDPRYAELLRRVGLPQ